MPVFYFDIAHGGKIEEDYDGKELHDLDAAREVAVLSAMDLLSQADKVMTGAVIQICDEQRQVLASVPVDQRRMTVSPRLNLYRHVKD
jgi:hypothetical protein